MKKCPYCAEEIKPEAIKCKHCGEMLKFKDYAKIQHEFSGCLTAFVSFFVPGVGQFIQGKTGAGLLFLLGAIFLSAPTFGIAWLIFGIISACSCSDIYKCSNCKGTIEPSASVCKHCNTHFLAYGACAKCGKPFKKNETYYEEKTSSGKIEICSICNNEDS